MLNNSNIQPLRIEQACTITEVNQSKSNELANLSDPEEELK